jgi:hypothetical protein
MRQRTLVERLREGLTLAVLDDLYAGHFVEPCDPGHLPASFAPLPRRRIAQGKSEIEFLGARAPGSRRSKEIKR